jgi:hypothetical protein
MPESFAGQGACSLHSPSHPPALLPQRGEGSFVSRLRDFHGKRGRCRASNHPPCRLAAAAAREPEPAWPPAARGVSCCRLAALQRAVRAWRTRWLFLSLFVIVAWGGAGEPAWNGALAPTREGLLDACTHGGRLLLALWAVAVLLEWMPCPNCWWPLIACCSRCAAVAWIPTAASCDCCWSCATSRLCHLRATGGVLLKAPANDGDEVFELAERQFSWFDPLLMLLVAGLVAAFCLRQV